MEIWDPHPALIEALAPKGWEHGRERRTDAWHRPLNDGRIEIMCCTPGYRIRVAAPEEQAWEAIEMFEGWTGLAVRSDRRLRRRPGPPTPGQLTIVELAPERSE